MTRVLDTVAALAAEVPSGASVILNKGESPDIPMALIREIVARGVRDLHLVTLPACAAPVSGMAVDLLVGAGRVAIVETSGVSLGELGAAPRFTSAVKAGAIRVIDGTCPAIYAAVQAGGKSQPFTTLRGIIGSDLLAHRDDWMVIENPFQPGDRVVALKAINPDFALLHAPFADRHGNLWIGRNRDQLYIAHAAQRVLATVEEVRDIDLYDDPALIAGTLPNLYVDALAVAPGGARAVPGQEDIAAVRAYRDAAATEEGFAAWLDAQGLVSRSAAE